MSTTNYSGRNVDLSIFPTILSPSVPVNAQITANPKAIAGAGMVAQNFTVNFTTPLGSYPGDPNYGSLFLTKIKGKQAVYPVDIIHAFAVEAARVVAYMQKNETSTFPDEVIASATLISQNITSESVSLNIGIATQGGATVSFLLPIFLG